MRISDWSSDVCSSDLRAFVGDPGIEVQALEVLARIARIVGGDQVRAHVEAMFDAADGVGEAATAVGQADLELGQAFQHAAEGQATGGARLLCERTSVV